MGAGGKKRGYRLIDHTADLGIEVAAEDLSSLFAEAARAMFDQIADSQTRVPSQTVKVELTGQDWPDLLVVWLRELLSFWSIEQRLLAGVRVQTLEPFSLSAEVDLDPYDPDRHRMRGEIKAVTYHQVSVEQARAGWMARIIFDI